MNIINVTYALPKMRKTIGETAQRLNISDVQARIFNKIFGLQELPIDLHISVEDLIFNAVCQCIEEASIDPLKIKYVIHTHTGNHILPFGESAVRKLQRKISMTNAIAFSMCMSKCGSVFVAFNIANELFKKLEDYEYILVLTGDVSFTEILQYIPGTTITTDGAAAILLSKNDDRNKLLNVQINIDGRFAGGIWSDKSIQHQFEKTYSNSLAAAIQKAVFSANLSFENIKLVLPHNVNLISWHQVAKVLNISVKKIFLENVAKTAHCFGTDPFINYRVAIERGLITPGDYFVFASVGLGATFAAMVFKA